METAGAGLEPVRAGVRFRFATAVSRASSRRSRHLPTGADQRGPARGAYVSAVVPLAPGRSGRGPPRAPCVHPGVWPCARTCALARSRRRRLHGCCVDRPAAFDAGGWGISPPHSPQAVDRSGGRGPPPGPCVPGDSDGPAAAWPGGCVDRRGGGRIRPNQSESVNGSCGQRFHSALRLAGCRRSDEVGPGDVRTVPPLRGPGTGIGRKRAVRAGPDRGTQRPESTIPLLSRATRASPARNARPGCRPAAFARGACTHDVRRP